MKKNYLIFLLLSCIASFSYGQSDVTFQVDMTDYTTSFTTVYVSGTFNSWSGDGNPLTDMGNGIWATTLPIVDGTYEFKFTHDNWTGQEALTVGDPCTATIGGYTNRQITVAGAPLVLPVNCWDACYACGGGPAAGDVTFSVDMSEYALTFGTVYVSGTINGWSGTSNPLTDMGNGLWEGTVAAIPAGAHQFKFTMDDWAAQETFTGAEACVVTIGGYSNRDLFVNGNDSYAVTCFNSCDPCGVVVDSVNITFKVNMSLETVDPAGVFIAGGGNFGNPGDYPMTDIGGGIYELTVRRPEGFSSFYTITNGACPNYSCKESLVGLSCGDPANFNDRFLMPVAADTTLQHCFAQCTEDLSCTPPAMPVNVVFQVDMSQTSNNDTVYVTGGALDNWCGSCLLMTDPDGDMVYTDTVALVPGTYEFKFNNGGTAEEMLDPSIDSLCTLTTGSFTNRIVTIGMTDTTLPAFCFESCDECVMSNLVTIDNPEDRFTVFPVPSDDYVSVLFNGDEFHNGMLSLYNVAGQTVKEIQLNTDNNVSIDVNDLPAGMYLMTILSDTEMATQKILIK